MRAYPGRFIRGALGQGPKGFEAFPHTNDSISRLAPCASRSFFDIQQAAAPCRSLLKRGFRHVFEVSMAPLRLRRGRGAMQGTPRPQGFLRIIRTPQGAVPCPFGTIFLAPPNPMKGNPGFGPCSPGGSTAHSTQYPNSQSVSRMTEKVFP